MTGKSRSLVFLLGALVLSAIASMMAVNGYKLVNKTETVIVASENLPAFTRIEPQHIKRVEVPLGSVPGDAILNENDLINHFIQSDILEGDFFRKQRLIDYGQWSNPTTVMLTHQEDPKLRAYAVPFRSTGASQVRPRDKVDVIASVRIDIPETGSIGLGKIIASNVEVLGAVENSGELILILALYPEQIEDIAFARTSGELTFALNPLDSDVTASETKGVTGEKWLAKYGFLNEAVDDELESNISEVLERMFEDFMQKIDERIQQQDD